MPENWSLPTNTSNYATGVLQVINNKLVDAVSLFATDGSNIPNTAMKYDRVANKFQERLAGVWTDKVLALVGGGTGAATAVGARTNLGLGSLAIQNDNAVNITGGAISGLTSLGINGTVTATLFSGSGASLTNLNADNLASGTVPTARLGSGTANNTVFLRGDQIWAAPAGTLPAGLIALFDVACPSGWTRFAALDGRFPRGAASYGGSGGADTHTHAAGSYVGPSHTHAAGTLAGASHNHSVGAGTTSGPSSTVADVDSAGGVTDVASASHTHTFDPPSTGNTAPAVTGSTASGGNSAITGSSGSSSNVPSYLDVIWCKKD